MDYSGAVGGVEEGGDHRFEAGLVFARKTFEGWTVDIEDADQFAVLYQWNDDLGVRCGIAGDVARERVHIRHQDRVSRLLADAPQTPRPNGMRAQATLPWNGPTSNSSPVPALFGRAR